MDRTRFEDLLAAYGADFNRWPAHQRASAALFAAQNAGEVDAKLDEARALDMALNEARGPADEPSAELSARILATAPRPARRSFDTRAMLALAACALFGVVLGYGGGLLAPPADNDDAYFNMAFGAPFAAGDEG